MLSELKELWKFRELLVNMVQQSLKARYKNSFFGFVWSLGQPLITVVVLTLVWKHIMHHPDPNYSAYLMAGYLPYTFFNVTLMDSSGSIMSAMAIMKKVYFPREILPLSSVISNFIHFLLAMCVFFAYLLFIYLKDPRVPVFQWTTVFLPLILLVHAVLLTGLSLILSALGAFYTDVKYILGVALWLLFFLSPIMYPAERVFYSPTIGKYYDIYMLNPIASLATSYRKILLAPQEINGNPSLPMDWWAFVHLALTAVILLIFGYACFNRLKWKFVERP